MSRIYSGSVWYEKDEIEKRIMEYKRKLSGLDIKKDEVIALYLERNIGMLLLMFAMYELGIPFLSLDINAPDKRNYEIVKEAGICKVLINTDCNINGVETVRIDFANEAESIKNMNSQIAYCIATSGTTGIPKIVETGRIAFDTWMEDYSSFLSLKEKGSILCTSEYTFDMFYIETFFARHEGLDIVLASMEEQKNPLKLVKLIRREKVSYLQMTPSRVKLIGMADPQFDSFADVKQIWLGGECIGEQLLKCVQKTGKKIINIYGPTETTVCCIAADVTYGEENIGTPLAHSTIYLLDQNNQPVNNGQTGEMCVSGVCLANGYYNNPEETGRKFTEYHGKRLYHTGDLAVKRQDGKYIFKGRMDNQVKLKGFRIELGEIEKILERIDTIKDICVLIPPEKEELAVLYVADNDIKPQIFIEKAKEKLPEYMIPYRYVRIKELPVTMNGKRDTQELIHILDSRIEYKAEKINTDNEDIEETILQMVKNKLETDEKISAESNLYDIGLDSLLYVELLVEIEDRYGIEFEEDKISYKALSSVRDIGDYIKQKRNIRI